MSTPETTVIVQQPAEYSAAQGAKKAATQTGLAWASILVPAVIAALSDPNFQGWLLAAVKDKPWAPVVAIGLQFGMVMLLNYQKNKNPKDTVTVGQEVKLPGDARVVVTKGKGE